MFIDIKTTPQSINQTIFTFLMYNGNSWRWTFNSQTMDVTTHFAHRRCSIFNLQQQRHDLAFLPLLRWQAFFINVDQEFVKILHVVWLHRWKVAFRLKIDNLCLAIRRLHAEPHGRAREWGRGGRQLASWGSDWNIPSWWLQDLQNKYPDHNLFVLIHDTSHRIRF